MVTLPFFINIRMSLNIALVSCKELIELPKLREHLKPNVFIQSTFNDYKKMFADLTLQIEKELFLNRVEIDLVFFANEDELDVERFDSVLKNPWGLDNSLFFTKNIESKQQSVLLLQKDYINIVNSNFFCRPETFLYLHILYKIPMTDLAEKTKLLTRVQEITPQQMQYLHFFHLLTILNISIHHLHYDR